MSAGEKMEIQPQLKKTMKRRSNYLHSRASVLGLLATKEKKKNLFPLRMRSSSSSPSQEDAVTLTRYGKQEEEEEEAECKNP